MYGPRGYLCTVLVRVVRDMFGIVTWRTAIIDDIILSDERGGTDAAAALKQSRSRSGTPLCLC